MTETLDLGVRAGSTPSNAYAVGSATSSRNFNVVVDGYIVPYLFARTARPLATDDTPGS
jgi:hypothetical protein